MTKTESLSCLGIDMLHGIITALVTPFKADGSIDYIAYDRLLARQVAGRVHGVVPCGSTGEGVTLSREERRAFVAHTVQYMAGKMPVVAGTGINSTWEAIDLARDAEAVGADALLIVTPYYNKPSQEGLYQHYKAIHDATSIPIYLYDAPGRTVVTLHEETIQRLAQLPRVVGLKDSSSIPGRIRNLRAYVPNDFCFLAGDDVDSYNALSQGGQGVISVYSNLFPEVMVALYEAWCQGKSVEVARQQEVLRLLMEKLFIETNPTPTKYLLSQMGLCEPYVRLPLVIPTAASQATLKETFREALEQCAAG